MVFEQFAQLVPAAVESGHHGADRTVGDLGDLFVREALDVGEADGQPKLGGGQHSVQPGLLVGAPAELVEQGVRLDPGAVPSAGKALAVREHET